MLDLKALESELQGDAYKGKDDQECADILNAPGTTTIPRGLISAAQFYGDLAARQITYKVKLLPDTTSPADLGNGVLIPVGAVKQAVEDLKYSMEANTGDATVQGMLMAGVVFGVLTQQQVGELLTRPGTRSEQLFGNGAFVEHLDVAKARQI